MDCNFFLLAPIGALVAIARRCRDGQNAQKNEKNGIFKMPPKIVVILVLGTPEHLELGLILQN